MIYVFFFCPVSRVLGLLGQHSNLTFRRLIVSAPFLEALLQPCFLAPDMPLDLGQGSTISRYSVDLAGEFSLSFLFGHSNEGSLVWVFIDYYVNGPRLFLFGLCFSQRRGQDSSIIPWWPPFASSHYTEVSFDGSLGFLFFFSVLLDCAASQPLRPSIECLILVGRFPSSA